MANTIDYSKIFASGATSQREWDDTDYIKGWETNGSIPPSVEKFDALQRNTDRKLKDLNERVEAAGEGGITEVNDNTAPTVDRDTIGNIIDAIAYQIKSLSGKQGWKDAPSINLDNVNLKALANLTGQADAVPVYSSANALGAIVLSTIGKSLLTVADAASARSTIGAASTSTATQSKNGLMTAADKAKLDGIAEQANKYSLPTASSSTLGGVKIGSNIAISSGAISVAGMTAATSSAAGKTGLVPAPAAGAQGKYLRGDGTWQTPTNTTYSDMTAATASAAGTHGLVPAPAAGKQAQFLRGDATWATPTNTTYSDFVKSGSSAAHGLVPKPPTTAGTTKYLREDGTWVVPPDHTYSNFVKSGADAAAGLVPKPSTTAGTTKYLREDGTWQVPPDNNTTYSNFVKSGSSAAAGLVPKPSTTAGTTHYLREDGTWTVPPNTTYSNFVKSGENAAAGLVPKPSTTAGTTKYLREDGTWQVPPNTTYSAVTSEANGLMTPAMLTRLGSGGGITAASLAANGYVKFANGFILQWGTQTNTSATIDNKTVTFPVAFASACYGIFRGRVSTVKNDSIEWSEIAVNSVTKTDFVLSHLETSTYVTKEYWFAIGK